MLFRLLRDAELHGYVPGVHVVSRGSSVHVSAAAALMCLAATDPVPAWGRAELQQLLRLLHVGDVGVRLYCVTAVWSLAQDRSNRQILYELGTAGILMDLLYVSASPRGCRRGAVGGSSLFGAQTRASEKGVGHTPSDDVNNTVRSFSTHGQQSAAQGSSTTVSRSDIRLIHHFDFSAHGLVRRWRLTGAVSLSTYPLKE